METNVSIATRNNNLINYLEIELTQQRIAYKIEKDDLSLFKSVLKRDIDILVMDDNFRNGDENEVAKFLLINPRLIIIYETFARTQ